MNINILYFWTIQGDQHELKCSVTWGRPWLFSIEPFWMKHIINKQVALGKISKTQHVHNIFSGKIRFQSRKLQFCQVHKDNMQNTICFAICRTCLWDHSSRCSGQRGSLYPTFLVLETNPGKLQPWQRHLWQH